MKNTNHETDLDECEDKLSKLLTEYRCKIVYDVEIADLKGKTGILLIDEDTARFREI